MAEKKNEIRNETWNETTKNVLEIKNVSKSYYNAAGFETRVLFDINAAFKEGSFSSIIGASGSGKSTLLNIMGTLDKPTSGDVLILGRNTVDMSKNELADLRNRSMGFVFQFHYLLPEFTAMENVLMPYLIQGKKAGPEVLRRADELLAIMGLSGVKNNLSGNMSGGQQQRTAIVRALINQPPIVFADEPTGNLDSESTESVYTSLRQINRDFGTTFIVITHDRRIAQKADRILEIRDGRIFTDSMNFEDTETESSVEAEGIRRLA